MSYTTFADREIAALLRLGLYRSREDVISDAVRNLLLNNRSLRLELTARFVQNRRGFAGARGSRLPGWIVGSFKMCCTNAAFRL